MIIHSKNNPFSLEGNRFKPYNALYKLKFIKLAILTYFIFKSKKLTTREKNTKMITKMRSQFRKIYNKRMASKLKNKDFSVIASNCNGTFILHDLGIRFNSPFVNLWIEPNDFVKMLTNLKYYMSCDLVFIEETDVDYPVGYLDDVKIYFQHYATPEEAREKWIKRVQRINYDSLFILFTDRDGCSYQNLIEFDSLMYKNKIVFTHIPYPELNSAFYLKGWEDEPCIGLCFEYKNKYTIKKHYDAFDFISWFNNGINY